MEKRGGVREGPEGLPGPAGLRTPGQGRAEGGEEDWGLPGLIT